MNNCNCKNIALINNDWLCLECGEKAEPAQNQNKKVKIKESNTTKQKQGVYIVNKLYNIFYNGCYDSGLTPHPYYQATTDNFKKWLEKHNKDRIERGEEPESAEEFNVEPISPFLYD